MRQSMPLNNLLPGSFLFVPEAGLIVQVLVHAAEGVITTNPSSSIAYAQLIAPPKGMEEEANSMYKCMDYINSYNRRLLIVKDAARLADKSILIDTGNPRVHMFLEQSFCFNDWDIAEDIQCRTWNTFTNLFNATTFRLMAKALENKKSPHWELFEAIFYIREAKLNIKFSANEAKKEKDSAETGEFDPVI
jgi:hypothetical protein